MTYTVYINDAPTYINLSEQDICIENGLLIITLEGGDMRWKLEYLESIKIEKEGS